MDVLHDWQHVAQNAYHPTGDTAEYWTSGKQWAAWFRTLVAPPASVLDFGCGDGRVTVHLAAARYRVAGHDPVAATRKRFMANPALAAVPCLASPAGLYDAVVCLAVLIHYPTVEGVALLRTMAACVRPGGVLVANLYVGEPRDPAHFCEVGRWTQDELAGALASCGLVQVDYSRGCVIAR